LSIRILLRHFGLPSQPRSRRVSPDERPTWGS
jgi:hypothetical protein